MRPRDFLKTKNVIIARPSETLSSVLAQLSSSHDAAFIFDNKKYMGIINPYHCLIKTSYPGNAKVEHCLFHAPRIKTNYSFAKVAQLMVESKVHYLPVFDAQKDTFEGIVSARHILALTRNSPAFNLRVADFLASKKKPVVTIYAEDLLSHAINMFKTYRLSKLVVVNKDMKLRGIVAYYDLIQHLVAPKKKKHLGDRKGDRISFLNNPVRLFIKPLVLTVTPQQNMRDALQQILEKSIGSVIVVDQERHPIGVITTRDFLGLLVKQIQDKQFEVIAKNLSTESRRVIGGFFNNIASISKKIPDIRKVRLFIKEEKGGGVFQQVISLIPKSGPPKIIRQQGKNLRRLLSESRATLKNMLSRTRSSSRDN